MRSTLLASLVIFTLSGSANAQKAESTLPEDIARLIQQLDDDEFKVREAAGESLLKVGDAALAPLKVASEDKAHSPELRMRAGAALRQLTLAAIPRRPARVEEIIEAARGFKQGKPEVERLEALLDRLVELVLLETGNEQKLPVRFADVQPQPIDVRSPVRRALVTLDSDSISSVRNSIVLAETAVDISIARDSIIIAGVGVSIRSADNCLVIAGWNVKIGGENNLVLSGGVLSTDNARDSLLASAAALDIDGGGGFTIINPPRNMRARIFDKRDRLSRTLTSEQVVLDFESPRDVLQSEITITEAVVNRKDPLVLFCRKDGDGEYVAHANKEICFPDGKPIPELAGWRLIYCGEGLTKSRRYAVFRKKDATAVVEVVVNPRG